MRRSKFIVKKLNLFFAALILFVGLFFCSGERVEASSSFTDNYSYSFEPVPFPTDAATINLSSFDISSSVSDDLVYCVDYSLSCSFSVSQALDFWNTYITYAGNLYAFSAHNAGTNVPVSQSGIVYVSGDKLHGSNFRITSSIYSGSESNLPINVDFNFTVNSISALSASDSEAYQNGYNAGYSAGESAGHSSGYSEGYSAGESAGYESGFSAGVQSVDTDSYYQAGYSTGYNSGYSEGYSSGYSDGYDSAMARIEQWGADTAEYPILLYESDSLSSHAYFYLAPYSSGITSPTDLVLSISISDYVEDINPNHTYKLVYSLPSNRNSPVANSNYVYSGYIHYLNFSGGNYYKSGSLFVEGSRLSDTFNFMMQLIDFGPRADKDLTVSTSFSYVANYSFSLYDYGPTNGTQNHIAKQTDDLTNGYDSSAGESAASSFADNAASYDAAEGSLFTSAQSNLDGFQFYDFTSNSSVLTGISFVSSIMSSLFGAMGGLSGAGIVLSVLFSVMFVSIVIGSYRYFVSSGHTQSGSRRGGEK